MADVISGADARGAAREVQQFGRIVVVGGGCYGSYYLRQLGRARAAGALSWHTVTIVDRDPECAAATLIRDVVDAEVVVEPWTHFFDAYLGPLADAGSDTPDAIVPSPLMPHLMADWVAARAAARWPRRTVRVVPLPAAPAVPWERAGDDGTHYVSFAEWMCPINCIEPARCPHTRGPRSWSMPDAVAAHVASEMAAGRPIAAAPVFHCLHRAFGVGMIDVQAVLDADRQVAEVLAKEGGDVLVGTVSHCHGAIRRLRIDDAVGERLT